MKAEARTLVGWAITIGLAAVVTVGFIQGDPAPEDRLATLGAAIKCPVCQGEAIIDSPSPTAEAMMEVLEEKIDAGETDQQIFDYFRSRFGDGIILDPPLEGRTLVVWLSPLIGIGIGIVLIAGRRRAPDRGAGP